MQYVDIIVVVQDLLLFPFPRHLDGTGSPADEQVRANQSTANPATRTGGIAKRTDLGDQPRICAIQGEERDL